MAKQSEKKQQILGDIKVIYMEMESLCINLEATPRSATAAKQLKGVVEHIGNFIDRHDKKIQLEPVETVA